MSDNTTITPRDDRETAVVGVGRRIATAIGIEELARRGIPLAAPRP
jgi:hypothetical protein